MKRLALGPRFAFAVAEEVGCEHVVCWAQQVDELLPLTRCEAAAVHEHYARLCHFSTRPTIDTAAKWPVALSALANVSGIASTAMRIPMPSTGKPIDTKSGASMMNP